MRRSGHPSRPRAITCCFFASLKTLLIPTKAKCLAPESTSRASFSLAGFQVTLIGRFWVTPEASDLAAANRRHDEMLAHSPWFKIWQRYGVCCRSESPVLRLGEIES